MFIFHVDFVFFALIFVSAFPLTFVELENLLFSSWWQLEDIYVSGPSSEKNAIFQGINFQEDASMAKEF